MTIADPRADGRDAVALDVGNCIYPNLGAVEGRDQLAVLDQRSLLAARIDFADGLAGGNHFVGHRAQVGQRHVVGQRLGERRRSA